MPGSLHLHVYRARLRTLSPLVFSGFPGPTLRGALGDDPEVYARLLAPPPALPQKRFSDPPRPLLLRPRFEAGEYGEGSDLELDFTLVGCAGAHLPALVGALARLGVCGIGEARNAGYGRFEVERVDALGPKNERAPVVDPRGLFRPVSLPWRYPEDFIAKSEPSGQPLRLWLQTPTLVNVRGLARGSLHFGDVVVDLLRRLSLFAQAYGEGPVHSRGEERAWEDSAAVIRIIDSSLRWVAVHRFSRKQERSMEFGGWLGWVEYDADSVAWLPLLRAAHLVQVGKHTAFGFGNVYARGYERCE